ncbi:MFS transporter [Fulvivirga sedimenti]|uniref:Endo-1,3-beta-glucanase btgC n=1 Tax=Fulvivirga sedimenti TaxID=2879465 RepID=A0A9X1HPA7_9BACT|nr:MFS transporter [Fulvivirga sedimenti]MCA6074661.1 MFS transporter [Fulvivirga sedimenti]MCA6075838.1 MFS transporter [Fulvivirga sedimenti]MCA6076966.1 MFS transporter [Fulvivirga sedimenti]
MTKSTQTSVAQVPFGLKVAFGIGMLANQMFPAALSIFMVVLVQDLGFPGWMWGVLFFLPRVFDAFSDPIMGFISDNTKSTWGRRRQYVFLGALVMGISFIIMWQLYRVNGVTYNFTFFLIWSFIFYLGLTIFSVPYVAMGYEMSTDFHERTDIMAVAQWIGQWAWVIAPWFWVVMYDPDWFESADVATRTLAIWVGVICMIFAMVPAIFIKSRSTLNENYSPLTLKHIGTGLKEILNGFVESFKIKPFRKLCIATFFIFNAFNTIAAFSFFIVVYYLFNGDAAAAGVWPTLFGSIGALVTTFAVIPVVARMSKKTGKKKAFLISQGISIIGYIMLWFLFIPGKPYMFIFALPFFSFGIGSLFVLMMSMTADVIDLDELTSGKRREGIFGAIYWWMVKFGFAIAGLLSGAILSVVGFDPDAASQTEGAIIGLRAFYSGVPILGTLVAMIVMWNYDVTEDRAHEIRAELDKRKEGPEEKPLTYYQAEKLLSLVRLDIKNGLETDMDFAAMNHLEIKQHYAESLRRGMHGLCFSPYEEGQDIGDILTESQIRRRMGVITPYTKWVRSFSCTEGNEFIPKVARERGLKTMVGAWISKDKAQNEKEINSLIELAKSGVVDIAAVGNEVLLRGELSKDELIHYIKRVKEALPNIQVGCVDTYYQFYEHPDLADACDVLLANCYPFWEDCDIDKATVYLDQMYQVVNKVSKGKPVIIAETGWPGGGEDHKSAKPSPENAMKYFVNVNNWRQKQNIEVFYFSSFDESWKVHHEGDVGQRWGIWDKNEKLKYS